MNVILGVDPGLAQTGFGLIQVAANRMSHVLHGTIETSPDLPTGKRLEKIHSGIMRIVKRYQPDAGGIESLFFAKNISSAIPVAQARGVVLLAFAQANIVAKEFPPREIKQMITGSGRADKQQVQNLVRFLLALEEVPKPDHAADALAVAICCFHALSVEVKLSQGRAHD